MKGRLLLFCLFFSVHAYSQNYAFHNFTSEEGLAQPYVYSIIQDSRGYLWLGTGNGLSRYNGFKFDNYSTSDSLADNFINCGINDGDRLWFGCINGRISYYDGKKFHTVKIP